MFMKLALSAVAGLGALTAVSMVDAPAAEAKGVRGHHGHGHHFRHHHFRHHHFRHYGYGGCWVRVWSDRYDRFVWVNRCY